MTYSANNFTMVCKVKSFMKLGHNFYCSHVRKQNTASCCSDRIHRDTVKDFSMPRNCHNAQSLPVTQLFLNIQQQNRSSFKILLFRFLNVLGNMNICNSFELWISVYRLILSVLQQGFILNLDIFEHTYFLFMFASFIYIPFNIFLYKKKVPFLQTLGMKTG